MRTTMTCLVAAAALAASALPAYAQSSCAPKTDRVSEISTPDTPTTVASTPTDRATVTR